MGDGSGRNGAPSLSWLSFLFTVVVAAISAIVGGLIGADRAFRQSEERIMGQARREFVSTREFDRSLIDSARRLGEIQRTVDRIASDVRSLVRR